MGDQLHARLKPVRRRQHLLLVVRTTVTGLLVGSLLGVVLGVCRLCGFALTPAAILIAAVAGAGLGLLLGLVWRLSWKSAAIATDARYELKDRVATALAFLQKPDPTVIHQLQIGDAVSQLAGVDARVVAPFRLPRALPYAVLALVAALVLVAVPGSSETATAGPTAPLEHILDEADRLEETMIEDLEELAREQPNEEFEQLVEELKELVEEMKKPGVENREAIAKLSEMQAAIAALQAEFNLEAVDASLEALGEDLQPADSLKSTAESLQKGKYDKAAQQLEKLDLSKIKPQEAKAISRNLKKSAKDMEDAGQGQLCDATSELAAGLEEGSESKCKGGACKLAGLCRKQGLRKKIGNCLGCQLALLAECKGNCSKAGNCQGKKNGGNCVAKSNSPKNTWGTGASGQPFGDKATRLDSTRNREEITGMHGEGPSEKETSHSPDGRQQAARAYRETYQKYRRMSEAVLESEPLPLGHRQTIRRYFESIRPENPDADNADLTENSE